MFNLVGPSTAARRSFDGKIGETSTSAASNLLRDRSLVSDIEIQPIGSSSYLASCEHGMKMDQCANLIRKYSCFLFADEESLGSPSNRRRKLSTHNNIDKNVNFFKVDYKGQAFICAHVPIK